MTMKTDFQQKQAISLFPALAFPIKISEVALKNRFPTNFVFNLAALGSLPLFMALDLTVGISALFLSLFNQNQKTSLKQTAWDCLFCGSFGAIFTACRLLLRFFKNR